MITQHIIILKSTLNMRTGNEPTLINNEKQTSVLISKLFIPEKTHK